MTVVLVIRNMTDAMSPPTISALGLAIACDNNTAVVISVRPLKLEPI